MSDNIIDNIPEQENGSIAATKTVFGHPVGLFVLFFTERTLSGQSQVQLTR